MYDLLLERAAERDLERLSAKVHDRVVAAILELAENPRPSSFRLGTERQATDDTDETDRH